MLFGGTDRKDDPENRRMRDGEKGTESWSRCAAPCAAEAAFWQPRKTRTGTSGEELTFHQNCLNATLQSRRISPALVLS